MPIRFTITNRSRVHIVTAASTICLLASCDDNNASICYGPLDCEPGQTCVDGYCKGGVTETDALLDCSGKPDFTPCSLRTAPDRVHDICVDEICISPGCGDAGCNVPGPGFPLPDTNQRQCFDDASILDTCPDIGDPLYGQDGNYGWDVDNEIDRRLFWTSTTSGKYYTEMLAWFVEFGSGSISKSRKTDRFLVRCVRGE